MEKSPYLCIGLTARPTFGMVMQFKHFQHSNSLNFKNLKIQHGGGRRLQKSKNRHISATI